MPAEPNNLDPPMAAAAERKARVVAVDDQPDALRLLQLRLQSAGFECLAFTDGEEALRQIVVTQPDVVILDVMMPGLDGLEICRRLKALEETKDIPVLFLTAKMEAEDKVKGLEVGGHDYLSKPVDHQELVARTRAAVRVKHLQDQLRARIELERQIHQLQQERVSSHWQRTLGQLAASLAHEINNPLAAALGSLELLRASTALEGRAARQLSSVTESLHRAGQRLRSLLLVAQASGSRERVDLSDLAGDVLALMNYALSVRKIHLERRFDRGYYAEVNSGQLARALLYVLDFWLAKSRGENGSRIVLSMARVGEAQHRIEILLEGLNREGTAESQELGGREDGVPQSSEDMGIRLASEIVQEHGGELQTVVEDPTGDQARTLILLPASS